MSDFSLDGVVERLRQEGPPVSAWSVEELFQTGREITYDDFKLLNTRRMHVKKDEIDLGTTLGYGGNAFHLHLPFIVSPMDTVVNDQVAIEAARVGGIACLHYNHRGENGKRDMGAQIEEIRKVKRAKAGLISDPICVSPDDTLVEAIVKGTQLFAIPKPIDNFPVTDTGEVGGRLIGYLRSVDIPLDYDLTVPVSNVLKIKDEKTVAGVWCGEGGYHGNTDHLPRNRPPIRSLEDCKDVLNERSIDWLPIVDTDDRLLYLATRSDIRKKIQNPNATVDSDGRYRVLFAVSTWPKDRARIRAGFEAGADGIVIDTSQGNSDNVFATVKYIRQRFGDALIIAGNISTKEAVFEYAIQGAHDDTPADPLLRIDGYRCGQGSGSICTTIGTLGIGRAAASAIYDCTSYQRKMGIPLTLIGDGGYKSPGDIAKGIGIGAGCVMLGWLIAGCNECPGEYLHDPESGQRVKYYRGMGSAQANTLGARGYGRYAQGIEGTVGDRGPIATWVPLLFSAVKEAFEVLSSRNISELHDLVYSGQIRFGENTAGALAEQRPHSVGRYQR